MNERFIREIFYYKHYYLEFFNTLRPAVQKKFNWTLQLIATVERIPVRYFEHITNSTGLFEIRVEVGSDIFRVFSFFDKGNLIILVNGFQKKTQKTPAREIELAEKLKDEYLKGQEARPESTKKNKKT
jgi:phage-related protein